MEPRLRASPKQFLALLEFMERHGDIGRPQQGPQSRMKADCLWNELGETLNAMGEGVMRPIDKWKKVWADWKTKTKKKALAKHQEASGTSHGPSSRIQITDPELRVLVILGMAAVVGQDGIGERRFNRPRPTRASNTECPSQSSALNKKEVYFIASSIVPAAPSSLPASCRAPRLPPRESSPVDDSVSTEMPSAMSPVATKLRRVPRGRQRPATSNPVASPTTSMPRRRRLFRARTRRVHMPFEQATNEFVAIENRRLQLEEVREENNHRREMEALRLESRRIGMEEIRNTMLNKFSVVLETLTQILPQIRTSSLPSTDTD